MFDPFVMLAPLLLLVAVALLHFVGCDVVFGLEGREGENEEEEPEPLIITWQRHADGNPSVALSNQVVTDPFPLPVQQGNLIVVWIFYASNAEEVLTVTDSAANTYQRAVGPTTGQGALAQYRQEIWRAENITSEPAVVVTATFTGSFNDEKAISAHEYLNASGIDPAESRSAFGNGANASLGPVSVGKGGLLFAAGIFETGASQGAGFELRSTLATNNVAQDQRLAEAGSYPAGFQNVAQDYVVQVIALIPKLEDA